ncbi:GATOR complex protein Iml1 isoform X2 [Oratosquilla oratoria]|uniref:GATOR complex protein Iml1 isoform X2 n=1 Tax=Oratosquilla oratoria TaxID=337810 RepID=UPI003F773B24
MKTLKLQKLPSREPCMLVNVKDIGPDVHEGDVIEIYHPEDDLPRLLLKIPPISKDVTIQKDTISIEQSITTTFQLRAYNDVIVNKVNPKDVELELVEMTFKDQYLGRSDMWRLKKDLVGSVVYLHKKIEFCGGTIRTQVYEMWAQGEKVACGVVLDDTKVVFRSSTSMVYLFIQMSLEMWEFDIYGDLYFEKTVNGFLAELFAKWKDEGSNHEVTIVLFSRTYYKANSLTEFPDYMQECLQEDYKGRFYEDFYRVVVQNEKYEDWTPCLTLLRRVFNNYQYSVLEHHNRPGTIIPETYNSSASQGNFLEVLNISLNVFEKHYLDRSFDRTGQVSVVITPGVGVFEVDRELTNITKQRIIDNGVGSDLVCIGEQPLHAVPLLKFHNKNSTFKMDDFSMPHTWINLSYYSSNKKIGYGKFVPRIKLPPEKPKTAKKEKMDVLPQVKSTCTIDENTLPNSVFYYDAYDAQVFKLPANQNNRTYRSLQRNTTKKKNTNTSVLNAQPTPTRTVFQRKLSDPDLYHSMEQLSASLATTVGVVYAKSPAINIPARMNENKMYSHSFGALNVEGVSRPKTQTLYEGEEMSPSHHPKVGSSGGPSPTDASQMSSRARLRPGRPLINPFDPSHGTIKLTSNRRRWTHIFPKNPHGVLIQQHHYHASSKKQDEEPSDTKEPLLTIDLNIEGSTVVPKDDNNGKLRSISTQISQESIPECYRGVGIAGRKELHPRTSSITGSGSGSYASVESSARQPVTPLKHGTIRGGATTGSGNQDKRDATLLWGATGEQEWNAFIITGVDWKSLTLPACLPITTDYIPADISLHNDYVVSDYNLLPDDINEHASFLRFSNKKPLKTMEVFLELISQRLSQGFQMIVKPDTVRPTDSSAPTSALVARGSSPRYSGVTSLMRSRSKVNEPAQVYWLSIGRIFHELGLLGSTITVTIYRPRHPHPQLRRKYKYRFQSPNNKNYEVSQVEFLTEKPENYMWNQLDNYICFRGESPDFPLVDQLKYWRCRILIVPECYRLTTKTLVDKTANKGAHYNIYSLPSQEELQATIDGFLRFIEVTVHRLKRPATIRKSRVAGGNLKSSGVGMSSGTGLCSGANVIISTGMANSSMPGGANQAVTQRRQSLGVIGRIGGSSTSSTSLLASNSSTSQNAVGFRERLGSNRVTERPRPRSGSRTFERLRYESGGREPHIEAGEMKSLVEPEEESKEEVENKKVSLDTPLPEIIELMKDKEKGLGFLNRQQGLPEYTFVIADAVTWICDRVEGVETEVQAVKLLQNMASKEIIRHASGSLHPVTYGFFLFFIVTGNKEQDHTSYDMTTFSSEWLEIGVELTDVKQGTASAGTTTTNAPVQAKDHELPPYLLSELPTIPARKLGLYKEGYLDVDVNNKSDRSEWGHIKYHSLFSPLQAYEFIIQWLCATGTIVTDLLVSWQRKAQTCGLHLFPVPSDPFALPYSYNSNPLRGPILIPLNVSCLCDGKEPFTQFPEDSRGQRMLLFQESILESFGFVPYMAEASWSEQHQFIHVTGNMFVMIHSPGSDQTRTGAAANYLQRGRTPTTPMSPTGFVQADFAYGVSSPHEEYIHRLMADFYSYDKRDKPGFLWSFNYMLTRRWRSNCSGENSLGDRMLQDFRHFCNNEDDRLHQFWEKGISKSSH